MAKLPLFDQLKRVNEEEWKNIPKIVKQTFRLLIDFSLEQKVTNDVFTTKTQNALEKGQNLSARQFKQLGDQLAGLEKQVGDKVKSIESNVSTSMKNIKDGLNRTISSFDMQIKDVLADNRMMSDKVRYVSAESEKTTESLGKTQQYLLDKVKESKDEVSQTLNKRIDNIVENNLTIPGIVDDPEGKQDASTPQHKTLKDYILNDIEQKEMFASDVKVSI